MLAARLEGCAMRVVLWVALLPILLPAQQHGYTPGDFERGSRLYAANCVACHGPEGDSIPGVSFRRGLFRRGSSDEDLMRTISTGIAGTPMPPGNFNPAELFSLVAYLNGTARRPHCHGQRPAMRPADACFSKARADAVLSPGPGRRFTTRPGPQRRRRDPPRRISEAVPHRPRTSPSSPNTSSSAPSRARARLSPAGG